MDFTIVYGLNNVGPTWTITHFKGPGGAGGGGGGSGSGGSSGGSGSGGGSAQGLLTMNRTLKDTLVISFAPACKGTDCKEATTEDFSLAADELSAESSESEASLHKNIQALTEQLDELKIPAHVTEVQRASLETTQALIGLTVHSV